MGNKDKTGNERQQRRRQREKEWLKEHNFSEWAEVHLVYFGYASLEALHTALMNGETSLTKRGADSLKAGRSLPAKSKKVKSDLPA